MDENIVRIEPSSADPSQFWMHTDPEDRKVTVLEADGWQFQFKGSEPFEMKEDQIIDIPEGMYHRVIKGKTDLVVKIEK